MSDKKISQLPASTTPLAGTEELAVVQSGDTKKVTVANLTAGRSVSASSVTATSAAFGSNALNIDSTNNRVVIGKSVPGIKKLDMQVAANDGIRLFRPGATVAHVIAVDGSNGLKIEMEGIGNSITIDNSRNIGVTAGNLVIGTSGKGIDFSADGSAAGMTSELLDDYEEGTWTPVFVAYDGTVTVDGATYVKIGQLVTAFFMVTFDGTTDSSQVTVSTGGFPFNIASDNSFAAQITFNSATGGGNPVKAQRAFTSSVIVQSETGGPVTYTAMGTGKLGMMFTYRA